MLTQTPPGVVRRDGAGEGRWTDRGAGPLTGLTVKEVSTGYIREDSYGYITQVSAR